MKNFLTPALLAGLLAALILTLVQIFTTTPLILQAEAYKQAGAHVAAEPVHENNHGQSHDHTVAAASHHHDGDAWTPEDGWQRTLLTAGANLVMGVGFALLLTGLYYWRNPTGWRVGLGWGCAGYFSVFVAPTLGLPPQLPGAEMAELALRQEWWFGTVLATAVGLALGVFARSWLFKCVGLALVVLPHVVGAPQSPVSIPRTQESLKINFFIASAFANAVFWLVLGVASSLLFSLCVSAEDSDNDSNA